jgi:hypothetical protein
MLKSKRGTLSAEIGSLVCKKEYAVWAKEFGDNISFELGSQICEGADKCIFRFRR